MHILIFLFHFTLSKDETRRITSICPSFNFRAKSKCGSHEVVAKPIFNDASYWPIMLQNIVKDSEVSLLFFCPCMYAIHSNTQNRRWSLQFERKHWQDKGIEFRWKKIIKWDNFHCNRGELLIWLTRILSAIHNELWSIDHVSICKFVPFSQLSILIYFQAFDEVMKNIQMYSKLEELLLKKKYFIYGDSPQLHAEKVIILISFTTESS